MKIIFIITFLKCLPFTFLWIYFKILLKCAIYQILWKTFVNLLNPFLEIEISYSKKRNGLTGIKSFITWFFSAILYGSVIQIRIAFSIC